jgi:hypothetical protein
MLVSHETCTFKRLAKNCSHAVLSSHGVRFLDLPLAWPYDAELCLLHVQHRCSKHADHATVPRWTRKADWYSRIVLYPGPDVIRNAMAKFNASEAAEVPLAPMT